jgi:hypothetical protein
MKVPGTHAESAALGVNDSVLNFKDPEIVHLYILIGDLMSSHRDKKIFPPRSSRLAKIRFLFDKDF